MASKPRKRKSLLAVVPNVSSGAPRMFERMSVFPIMAQFLPVTDLLSLCVCNRSVRKSLIFVSASNAVWPIGKLPFLRADTRGAVRRVSVDEYPSLPDDVNYVRFCNNSESALNGCRAQIKTLVVSPSFSQPLASAFVPSSLTCLNLGSAFNVEIPPDVLPPTLTKLIFSEHFNQKVLKGSLPLHLRHLEFGNSFDQYIEKNVYPPKLTLLKFGVNFKKPILAADLQTLTVLELAGDFNLRVTEVSPSLTVFKFRTFSRPITRAFGNLVQLDFGTLGKLSRAEASQMDFLNRSPLERFPPTLTELRLGAAFNHQFPLPLPSSLTILYLGYYFNQRLEPNTLPQSLLRLQFGQSFNQPLKLNSLPPNLTYLQFGDNFNQPLSRTSLPRSLRHVQFGRQYDCMLKVGSLPRGLLYVLFGRQFNRPFAKNVLPSTLRQLTLGDTFNQPLGKGILPAQLREFVAGIGFSQRLENGLLPPTLTTLKCPNAQILSTDLGYAHWISLRDYSGPEEIPPSLFG